MGNVIQVDFRQEKKKETDAFRAFELAMLKHEKTQRFKTAGMMVGFSLLIIAAMSLPFVFDYFGRVFF